MSTTDHIRQMAIDLDPTERRMLHMIADGNMHKRGNKGQVKARQRLTRLGLLGMDDRKRFATSLGIAVRSALLEEEATRRCTICEAPIPDGEYGWGDLCSRDCAYAELDEEDSQSVEGT